MKRSVPTRIFRKARSGAPFLLVFGIAFLVLSAGASHLHAAAKVTIGAVEEVVLLPWGVKVLSRIDTGAATSSLDVCDYRMEGKYVLFTLPDRCGGFRHRQRVLEWREVKATEGRESRPVVEIDICVGERLLRTRATLNDRSHLEHPFLMGRNTLEGNFIVDVSQSRTKPARCPAEKTR